MSRILLLETNLKTLGWIESTLSSLGYGLVDCSERGRLKLEMRARDNGLVLASAEAFGGQGLELVAETAFESIRPVPAVFYSSTRSELALRDAAPVEVILKGLLGSPISELELLQTITAVLPPPKRDRAAERIAELRSSGAAAHGPRLHVGPEITDLRAVPLERVLWAAATTRWTGRITAALDEGDAVDLFVEQGRLTRARTVRGKDLVATARAEGKLKHIQLPDVPLRGVDEELGLLMAMRAIGMHETARLCASTAERLVHRVAGSASGAVQVADGETTSDPFGAPIPLLRLLRGWYVEGANKALVLGTPLTAEVVVRLPAPEIVNEWGLPPGDRPLLDALNKARGRAVEVEQLIRVATGGEQGKRAWARSLLVLFNKVGFVDFRGAPWPDEVSEQIVDLITRMHAAHRATLFEVLDVPPKANSERVKDAARELVRTWHPDNFFESHPRVRATAEVYFERIQEAYETLVNEKRRDRYLAELETTGGSTQVTAKDPQLALVSMKQGDLMLRNRRYADAILQYRDATLHDPSNAMAFVMLAWCRFVDDNNTSTAALDELRTALELDPRCAEARYYEGRIMLIKGQLDRARKRFKQALELDPRHVDSQRQLRLLERRDENKGHGAVKPTTSSALRGIFGRKGDGDA